MSFLSDLFKGNVSNLGSDLSPSNLFSDAGSDFSNQPTWAKGLEIAAPVALATLATGGADLPALPELFATDASATAAADTGFDLATIGPGVAADAGSVAATDAATSAGFDLSALGLTSDATSAFATDPALAAINSAAPLGATGASDAASIGTLSVPGVGDSAVGAGDITNFAGTDSSTAAGSGSFWDKLVGGAESSLTKNPLGIAAATGALGLDILKGNKTDPNQQALQNEAPQLLAQGGTLTASGQQLQTYLTNGTLPPALQSQVTSAVAAEKARIIQNHASNGENTNPTQNSALAQELSQADMNGLNLAGQLEQQLFTSGTQLITTGLNETGLSTQLYETLARMDQTNNNQIMAAIASMAAALGGGTKISIGSNSIATG